MRSAATMNTVPEDIALAVEKGRSFLLATHIYPDGDALGSLLALGDILKVMGKDVFLYTEEPVSHLYEFLPGSDGLGERLGDVARFDCAIALDCGDRFRLGRRADRILTVKPTLMIDHHAGHKLFGDLQWVEPGRSSTGEMVFELSRRLGVGLSRDAAFCLYAAIVSDTGSFKYSCTSPRTMRIAADLLDAGVDPAEVAGKLFDNFTLNRLRLLKRVLETLEMHADGGIAIILATRAMFADTGTRGADTENFINYPRSLATVRVAAFLKETDESLVSVSLRSKGEHCNVARIAALFGGGGHRNAAGFKCPNISLEEVRVGLLVRLRELMATGCGGDEAQGR